MCARTSAQESDKQPSDRYDVLSRERPKDALGEALPGSLQGQRGWAGLEATPGTRGNWLPSKSSMYRLKN